MTPPNSKQPPDLSEMAREWLLDGMRWARPQDEASLTALLSRVRDETLEEAVREVEYVKVWQPGIAGARLAIQAIRALSAPAQPEEPKQ